MEGDNNERVISCRESLTRHREALQARLDSEENAAGEFYASGKKDDAGKQRWYAMPLCVLKDLADTFNVGREKYGVFNCLQAFDNPKERFWDAMMRHLKECQIDPLSKDPETGCYHAACVAFNALMYLYHCKRGANGKAKG